MPIPIKKEPAWVTKETNNLHEKCVFCNKSTAHWHTLTNTPICVPCTDVKNISDIPIK